MRYNLNRVWVIEVYYLRNSKYGIKWELIQKSNFLHTLNNKELKLNEVFEEFDQDIKDKRVKIKIIEILN